MLTEHSANGGVALSKDIVYRESRLGGVEDCVVGASDSVLRVILTRQQLRR